VWDGEDPAVPQLTVGQMNERENGMRILGVDIARRDLSWVVVEGNRRQGEVQTMQKSKLMYGTTVANLEAMMKLVEQSVREAGVQRVAIVKATAGTSVQRAKIEFAVELVCHQLGVNCRLVAPQTISAAEKRKLAQECSPEFEAAIRGVSPKYLTKAAVAAWCVLDVA